MKAKELIRMLEANGWILDRCRGSHMMFKKNGTTIPIPNHGAKDIATGTLHAIMKQAGLK